MCIEMANDVRSRLEMEERGEDKAEPGLDFLVRVLVDLPQRVADQTDRQDLS